MDVTYLLLLSSLGLAITTQAQDCPIPELGTNMGFKDAVTNTFPNGAKLSLQCNIGFSPAGGSLSITCTNGVSSPVTLTCERKSCGSPGEVENGYTSGGIEFGDEVEVTCNVGYDKIGNGKRVCGDQGWLGRLPTCEAVPCDTPEPLTNGRFSPDRESYKYPEVVRYECDKDYTLSGSRSSSCSADRTFKPDPPKCIKVQCNDPDVTNGKLVAGSRPPFKHLASVTLQCLSGYIMKGEPNQKCELDSQWAPGLPTCQPVLCDDPNVKNAKKEEGSKPPYNFKSTVTFSCISEYSMKGDRTQTCGPNGQWAPGLPTCELMPTTKRPSTTKKTIDESETEGPPGNGKQGNGLAIGLGVGLTVLIGGCIIVFCYCFGVPACIKEKKRSRRSFPGNVAPTADEEVALS